MKGKKSFSLAELKRLEELIILRNNAPSSEQKSIRQKMRNIGFYGKDDWGITDLQISDLKSLIELGRINIFGAVTTSMGIKKAAKNETNNSKPIKTTIVTTSSLDLNSILKKFEINLFDPRVDTESKVANSSGNYIICLQKESKLPSVSITPIITNFEGYGVIYTGIASKSLKTRDYRQHFVGDNAGRSTLRKSLGVLLGFNLVLRDKKPGSTKTKFNTQDEKKLTVWMQSNLIMFFLPTIDFNTIEITLINKFNPPLNLKDNHNPINCEFRQFLSSRRSSKAVKDVPLHI